jgi:hypothetical protein
MKLLTEEKYDDEEPYAPVVDDIEKPEVVKECMQQRSNSGGCARPVDVGARVVGKERLGA